MPVPLPRTAIVLSAGGARGAYQVGVIAGIADVLDCRGKPGSPLFDTFVGTSIGAINATYLAANADRSDHRIAGLVDVWRNLDFDALLRLSPHSVLGWRRGGSSWVGRSLCDPRPIAALIERTIAWDRLRANVRAALVRALVIAAFELDSGRTTLFSDLAPGIELLASASMRRSVPGPITLEHVLASTALPMLFPALDVGGHHYMDGALRLSTPLHPALRAGADRVLVISLLHRPPAVEDPSPYPGFRLLLGKVLSALLLDPVLPDLHGVQRVSRMLARVAEHVEPHEMYELTAELEHEALLPSRVVPAFEFRPSVDLALVTAEFIRDGLRQTNIKPLDRWLIRSLGRPEDGRTALLASFLLLDGGLARRFIELGRKDAHRASEQLREFFLATG